MPNLVFAVVFNTDILDSEDKSNIDMSRFSEAGYIMPGNYALTLRINERSIKDIDVTFYERPEVAENGETIPVEACLRPGDIAMMGLKPEAQKSLATWHNGECADFRTLAGMSVKGDLSSSVLSVSIPQALIEYQDSSWLPPSSWDDGIPGLMVDYNVNSTLTLPQDGDRAHNTSGTGVVGGNIGPWRLRGDWQGSRSNNVGGIQSSFEWSRIYAFRALRSLKAKLTMGEDYLTSNLFDSWRYTGMSLVSDDRMLPPRLRGYAPEVTGVARTNAKVVISQQGRIIYQTTVASGPFRIQDLNDAVNGQLDVRVEEQDGSVRTFQIDTATVPYLTRPGQLRYKFAVGRPSNYGHKMEGSVFGTAEFSWGITNAWSLYGGTIIEDNYDSFAAGIGRDLLSFGALSADVTQSIARLPTKGKRKGKSWRLSYSKRFDEYNSEVTFAGYRFSERDYLSMGQYLDARYRSNIVGHDKELYTVTANKSFSEQRITAYLSWSHQTYWDRPDNNRYSFSLSRYLDVGNFHNLSVNLSASRSEYKGRRDDAAYLSLSIPFAQGSTSYSGNFSNNSFAQTVGIYQRLDNGDSYRLQAGSGSRDRENLISQASGYYTHKGDMSDMTSNISWSENDYTSAGISLTGGFTATTKGAALHPGGTRGGTRILVSTDGISGVPIEQNERTNLFGFAVVSDVASYYRNSTSIDVNRLPDDVEAAGSPIVESALTEGAIGYHKFEVLKGAKVVAILRMADGSHPPFGATILSAKSRELGIVSDGGVAWLTGISSEEKLNIVWGGEARCQVQIPKVIPVDQLLLPCIPLNPSL